jgi:hypothetical protein
VADLYFDPQAGNDANPGTAVAPKQNPQSASYASGYRLLLKRGTTLTLDAQWVAPNFANIYLGAWGDGPKPVITVSFDPDTQSGVLAIDNRQGWTVEGIRFVRPRPTSYIPRACINLGTGTANTTFRECDFIGGADNFRIINYAANTVIERCLFEGAFTDCLWAQPNGLIVRDCDFRDYSIGDLNGDGVQTSAAQGIIIVEGCQITMPLLNIKQGIHIGGTTNAASIAYLRKNIIHNPGNATPAVLSLEGQGVIEGNIVTGNVTRGIQITSQTAGHTAAVVRNNIVMSDLSGSGIYGIVIDGAHVKDVEVRNNTLIGGWGRCVYSLSYAMPSGSTYTGGANHINCKFAGRAFWNDSATAWSSLGDAISNTTGADVGSVTRVAYPSGAYVAAPVRFTSDARRPQFSSPARAG